MNEQRRRTIRMGSKDHLLSFVFDLAKKASGGAISRLGEPVRLLSTVIVKHIDSGAFSFYVASSFDAMGVTDEAIAQAYANATGKPVVMAIRMGIQGLPQIATPWLAGPEKDKQTVFSRYGSRMWYDPYNREARLINPDPDAERTPDDVLQEKFRIYFEEPLRRSLRHVPDVNAGTLIAETVTETFYLLFRAALDGDDARIAVLTPLAGLYTLGIVPVGERFGTNRQMACIAFTD